MEEPAQVIGIKRKVGYKKQDDDEDMVEARDQMRNMQVHDA